MATPWLKEHETGRYYMNYTYPDGETIRRYEDDLQQEQGQSALQGNAAGSSRVYPVDQRDADTRNATSSRRRTRETPRSESRHIPVASTRGTRRQSVTQSIARPELAPRRSSRQEGKQYHDSQGYNQSYRQRVEDRAGYDEADAGPRLLASPSLQDPIYTSQEETFHEEVSATSATDITTGMDQMTMGIPDFPSSPNYEFSPSHESTYASSTPVMRTGASRMNQWSTNTAQTPQYTANIPQNSLETENPVVEGYPFPGRRIDSTPGRTEPLDPSFKMRNRDWRKFFMCGRVFKTLWTDPYNPNEPASEHGQFPSHISLVAHGERVHSKVRRFVVVTQKDRSCQCLPITTYDGKGYKKRGISINEHGLIYTDEQPPRNVAGMDKISLKLIVPERGSERFTKISYINYGRTYSIDCYIKVKDLGELDKKSKGLLCDYFNHTMFACNDYSAPGIGRNPESQGNQLIGIGTGLGPYATSQSTSTSSGGNRRPSMSQRQDSQYQIDDRAGSSTYAEYSVATEYSGIASDQAASDERHWPVEDDGHVPAQLAPFTTLGSDAGLVSNEEDPVEQPPDIYESETVAGPSNNPEYCTSVEPSQGVSEPFVTEREDREEYNDPLAQVQSRQPQKQGGSSGRRRRRHHEPRHR